jgi:hypothetical protein
MKKLFMTTFLLAFSVLVIIIPASSQTKEQKKERKVFAAIPENLRAKFVERLNLYVEYERTKQYEKLYDLLLESVATSNGLSRDDGLSRDEYVNVRKKAIAEKRQSILLKFKPISTLKISLDEKDTDIYEIFGTGKVDDGKKIYEINAAIDARLINGEWYFSGVGSVIYD